MSSLSPLSAFLDEPQSQNTRKKTAKRSKKKALFAGVLLLLPSISTALAGQISLGDGTIEFGQGSEATAVCDSNITVDLQSTYDSGSSTFKVSTVTLGDLDTRVAGCSNKTLKITALNSSGTALDLNGSGTGSTLDYTVSGTSGAAETRIITLDGSANVNSTAVSRVLIETSG